MTKDHAVVYRDKAGEWRSRVIAANGNTIFDGAEGYANREDCVEMIRTRFGPITIDYENDS